MKTTFGIILTVVVISNIVVAQSKKFQLSTKHLTPSITGNFQIEWQRYFDERNVHSDEVPIYACVDEQKNIYSTSNFRTMKVDSSGKVLWISSWDGGYGINRDRMIFIDKDRNVFVTGESQIRPAPYQVAIAMVKYDHSGKKLWDRWYSGYEFTATRGGYAQCDSKGNIYITGFIYKDLPDTVKYALIKYSPEGVILWKIEYPAYNSNGHTMTVDLQDNVYITGYLYDPMKKAKYGIVKFNSTGKLVWFAETSYSVSEMIVDPYGTCYVTQVNFSNGPDVYASKYSVNGVKQWEKKAGSYSDYIIKPIVDDAGSLFLSTSSIVSKFTSNGFLAWQKSAPKPIESSTTVMGKNGNLYFLGSTDLQKCDTAGNIQSVFSFSSTNQALLRLDPDDHPIIYGSVEPNDSRSVDIKIWKTTENGSLLWSNVYDFGLIRSANWVKHMIVDEEGNALIAGGMDNLLVVYNSKGDMTLNTRFRTVKAYEEVTAVCTAPDNSIVIASESRIEGSSFISKITRSGNLVWRKFCTENGEENFQPKFILTDREGNVILCGETYHVNNFSDIITVKYDAGGNILWRKRFDGAQHREDYVYDLKIDNTGNIYVVGATVHDPKFATDVLVIKYSPQGDLLWKRTYEGEDKEIDEGFSAALDPASNIYIGGTTNFFVLGTHSDFLLVKYSNTGDSLWSYHTKHGVKIINNLSQITMLSDQSIVGTGIAYGSHSGGFGLVRIGSSGNHMWSRTFDSSFSAPMYTSWNVTSNSFNEIGVIALVHNSYDEHDLIFYLLNENGEIMDGYRFFTPPGYKFDPMGIQTTPSGDFIITGNITGGFESVIYLLKIGRTGETSVHRISETIPDHYSLLQNYPNPFNPSTTIRYGLPAASHVKLTIYNVLGQEVGEVINGEKSSGWHETVWKANVSSGLYFYRIDAASTAEPNQQFTQLKKMILLK